MEAQKLGIKGIDLVGPKNGLFLKVWFRLAYVQWG
jgi:hypothetical protein